MTLIVLMTISISSCSSISSDATEQKAAPEPATTEIISLHKEKLSSSIDIPGELIAFQQVDLYAKVSSFVKSLEGRPN
jgi:multidrug efflux pump subunit AcrA (membrane-fusion protein)